MEDDREQSFNTRAGALAGFNGLTVSVSGALGANVFRPDLATPWKWTAVSLLAATLVALVSSVFFVVFGVLMPRESVGFSLTEVERYPTWAFISQERVQMQGRILHGLIEMLVRDRARNTRKASHLRRGYLALGVAVVLLAALGGILGLHAERLI